jgi:hypothetical protein
MKKGCILKSFFILILVLGIGYHLYTEYGREFIEESKEDLLSLDYEDLLDELSQISESDYSDSLKLLLTDLMEHAESENIEESREEIEETLNSVKEYLEDNELDLEEYNEIKKILEEYERSAKIRD